MTITIEKAFDASLNRHQWVVIVDGVADLAFDTRRAARLHADQLTTRRTPPPPVEGTRLVETLVDEHDKSAALLRRMELRAALATVFGAEWDALARADQTLIERDCTEDGGVADLRQYQQAIGPGHLASYVKTQRVRFARPGGRR